MKNGIRTVRVVEYLEDSMSNELLSKFPQQIRSYSSPSHLKLDFNYSESSIWSPLVKPHLPPLQLDNYEKDKKKILSKPLDSQNLNVCVNNMMKQSTKKKMKLKKISGGDLFDSSPAPLLPSSDSHVPKKRWANILKAAPKCFKKSSKKKNYAASHLSLSMCFHGSMV